jgi:hypothetical protein
MGCAALIRVLKIGPVVAQPALVVDKLFPRNVGRVMVT